MRDDARGISSLSFMAEANVGFNTRCPFLYRCNKNMHVENLYRVLVHMSVLCRSSASRLKTQPPSTSPSSTPPILFLCVEARLSFRGAPSLRFPLSETSASSASVRERSPDMASFVTTSRRLWESPCEGDVFHKKSISRGFE